jgi:hypothetical protein
VPLSDRLTERDIVARAEARRQRSPLAQAAWGMLWVACACIVLTVLVVLAFCLTANRLPQ